MSEEITLSEALERLEQARLEAEYFRGLLDTAEDCYDAVADDYIPCTTVPPQLPAFAYRIAGAAESAAEVLKAVASCARIVQELCEPPPEGEQN
jgi:hypothetical protein